MKISELQKQLIACISKWGDREVKFLDLSSEEKFESVESIEFNGKEIILGDLTRAQDNAANAEFEN